MVGFTRRTEDRERRHIRAEKRHQQDKPIDRPTRDEVIFSGIPKKFMAQRTKNQDRSKINKNDRKAHRSPQSPRALTKAAISNVATTQYPI